MQQSIYLDHAAATPLDQQVLLAMTPYFATDFYNPSATYLAGKHVRAALDDARARIAGWLGARPIEVTFTAGGTESDNLAIHGIMQQYPGANCVVSAIEHDAVLRAAATYDCRIAPVKPDGAIDLAALEHLIDDNTVLVSVMYANNEIGTVQPLKQLAQVLATIRGARTNGIPLYLHTDACQAANYLDLHVSRLGVDLLTLNAGKMYGPKQVGALYVRTGVQLLAQTLGGGQERGIRSGTENVPGIIGFAKALDIAQDMRGTEVVRLQQIQRLFMQLLQARVPGVQVNGSLKQRLPNNVHITIPGFDNERLMMQLDEQGIMVAQGSACSASSQEPSHVLAAIGVSEQDARASLRITMGRSTAQDQIRHVVDVLCSLVTA